MEFHIKMKNNFKILFDKHGNQLVQSEIGKLFYYEERGVRQINNYEFTSTLIYSGYKQSRSGLHIKWIDETGKEYISSEMLLDRVLSGNYPFSKVETKLAITGTFTFKKQGSSIFLILKS